MPAYTKPTIVGYNANPPPDDSSETEENEITWAKHVEKLAGPIKTLLDAVNSNIDTTITNFTTELGVGADIASATALPVDVAGRFHDVTGTTTITSFAAVTSNDRRLKVLQFDGALTLTHNSADLILPGGVNIVTAAGDIGVFYMYAAGDWRCVSWMPASGKTLGPILGTSQATTSGASVTFSIPSWATEIVVSLVGVSGNGTTDAIGVRLGDAGGLESTDYLCSVSNQSGGATANNTTGFQLIATVAAANVWHGRCVLTKVSADGTVWAAHSAIGLSNNTGVHSMGGSKALSGALTQVALVILGTPTDAFDAGSVNVRYS